MWTADHTYPMLPWSAIILEATPEGIAKAFKFDPESPQALSLAAPASFGFALAAAAAAEAAALAAAEAEAAAAALPAEEAEAAAEDGGSGNN